MRLARGEGERYGRSSIRGNHMNLGGPSAAGLADGLGAVFFRAPVPSGCTLTRGRVQGHRFDLDADDLIVLQLREYAIQDTDLRPAICQGEKHHT